MNYFGPCEAMQKAGITDPDSDAGKAFCTESCPYDKCVLFEPNSNIKKIDPKVVEQIFKLRAKGMAYPEIAYKLGISERSVFKYLKKRRQEQKKQDE